MNTASVTTTQTPTPQSSKRNYTSDAESIVDDSEDAHQRTEPNNGSGQVLGYTIVVTNTGNQTLTGVNTTDLLPNGLAGTLTGPTESISTNGQLNVGETWTYTINYTVSQANIDAGSNLVNTASVTTTQNTDTTKFKQQLHQWRRVHRWR